MLAKTYDPDKHGIGGWYMSEKLDGMRAFWDGGISRGKLTSEVPYANTEKDYKRIYPVRATGLWSRYMKPIQAPDWFLDKLPGGVCLDGELYLGRGRFQETMSIVRTQVAPPPAWSKIGYYVFDQCDTLFVPEARPRGFWNLNFEENNIVVKLNQIRLPSSTAKAVDEVYEHLDAIACGGGEGLMLRHPGAPWTAGRTDKLLKVKKFDDAEGIVTGYIWGEGKFHGMMGALCLRNPKTGSWTNINISGFTDEERVLQGDGNRDPGTFTKDALNIYFPIGKTVTFKYQGVTNDGIPRFARYYRSA